LSLADALQLTRGKYRFTGQTELIRRHLEVGEVLLHFPYWGIRHINSHMRLFLFRIDVLLRISNGI
jgi:hypothetical protein